MFGVLDSWKTAAILGITVLFDYGPKNSWSILNVNIEFPYIHFRVLLTDLMSWKSLNKLSILTSNTRVGNYSNTNLLTCPWLCNKRKIIMVRSLEEKVLFIFWVPKVRFYVPSVQYRVRIVQYTDRIPSPESYFRALERQILGAAVNFKVNFCDMTGWLLYGKPGKVRELSSKSGNFSICRYIV